MTNREETHNALRALAHSLSPVRRRQAFATVMMMLVGAVAELFTIGAVMPLLIVATDPSKMARAPLIDHAFHSLQALTGWSVIVIAAAVLMVVTVIAAAVRLHLAWVTQKLIYGVNYDLGIEVVSRLVRQPYEHYVRQNSSAALAALSKVHTITVGIVAPLLLALTSAGIALGILLMLLAIAPGASIIAAGMIGVIYVGISYVSRRRLAPVSVRTAEMWTERTKVVQELLGGLRDITLDRSQHTFQARLGAMEREIEHHQIVGAVLTNGPRFVVESVGILLIAVLALWYNAQPGGVLAAIPQLGALAVGAQRLLPLLQTCYLGWAGYALHQQSLRDVLAILDWEMVSPVADAAQTIPLDDRIELRGLSYHYNAGHRALSDIDLTIAKGERVGIIGRTGSGKSTLADLLMGLLTPTAGEMIIDGKTLTRADIGRWQTTIAHVPQSIFLSDDSIGENIAFGVPRAAIDAHRVRTAAARAGILTFVETLPEGFDTAVGERGIRLSGGQRQRIGIARALYREARILFFDEATSALDTATEAEIMDAVFDLDGELTIVLIAHRLSTLSRCDVIYRLEAGRIVEAVRPQPTDGGATIDGLIQQAVATAR